MTVTVKAQQIISGYLRAASPALVLFVIQLMAYFVFVTINDIQLLPTEWGVLLVSAWLLWPRLHVHFTIRIKKNT